MRTAVAFIAVGIALISFADAQALPQWALALGLAAVLGGAVVAIRAARSWARVERALRLGEPLPPPGALFVVAAVVVVAAAVMAGIALGGLFRG